MAKLLEIYKGFELRMPISGGKAGKGFNKTSTIQVTEKNGDGYLIKKQFSYKTEKIENFNKAIEKARHYIDNLNF